MKVGPGADVYAVAFVFHSGVDEMAHEARTRSGAGSARSWVGRWTAAVAVVPVVVVLSGCSGLSGEEPVPVRQQQDDVTLWVWSDRADPETPSLLAPIEGDVAVADSGCVVLHQTGGDASPMVWPAGTELVSGEPLLVRLPDGTEVTAGATVVGEGGHSSRHDGLTDGGPGACIDGAVETAVLNPNGRVAVEAPRKQ